MAKGKIYSGDTLCMEINSGAKIGQSFKVDNQADSNSQQSNPSSTSQSTEKITGVHFDDLDYVTFDPIVDPEPSNCFNCWEEGHSRDKCLKPKCHDFCHNCGRRDVRVTTCPRCSRAYVGYWKKSRREGMACEFHDDAAKSLVMELNTEENEDTEYQMEPIGNDQHEGFSSTESGYCEEMIVDEEKRSLKFTGKFLEDFLNLLNAMKHLPIDTQNTIILKFVEDRRELMKEESMVSIRIPSISRVWEISRSVGYYLYSYGQNLLSKFMELNGRFGAIRGKKNEESSNTESHIFD